MSTLIVSLPWRLQSAGTPPSSGVSGEPGHPPMATGVEYTYALTGDAGALLDSGSAPLNLLPQADKTILVAPVQALSWHQIDLPKIPKARLRMALDGLLEEHLLDDTQAMSFALSPGASAGKAATGVWVAACDKTWLAGAIASFETAGCRVTQVVPALWPAAETVVCVTGTTEEAWLTRAAADGVLTLPLHSNDLGSASSSLLGELPADATVFAEPAVAALAERALARPVVLRQGTAGLLQSAQSDWELAQFEQRLSGDGEGVKRLRRAWQAFWQTAEWRPTRWGLVGILAANVIGLNAWAWQQQSSLTAKRAQLGTLLTQTFPNVKVVVEPQLQMEKEMALLRQATGAVAVQNFESMLSAFSTSAGVNIETSAIEFEANTTILKGIRLPDPELNRLQARLKDAGYSLKIDGDRAIIKAEAGL